MKQTEASSATGGVTVPEVLETTALFFDAGTIVRSVSVDATERAFWGWDVFWAALALVLPPLPPVRPVSKALRRDMVD
jgi:hypothetical protein